MKEAEYSSLDSALAILMQVRFNSHCFETSSSSFLEDHPEVKFLTKPWHSLDKLRSDIGGVFVL